MNLKEFIKDKKFELANIRYGWNEPNYRFILLKTINTYKNGITTCIIFDNNLNITFIDNTITDISSDGSNIFTIKKNQKYGVVDYLGNEILPCVYDDVDLIRTDSELGEKTPIWVKKNKKEAFIDRKGNQLTKFYDNISFWFYPIGYFVFKDANFLGVINILGNELFKLKCEDLKFLTDKILIYKNNFKCGLITINGKILTEAKYEDIKKLNENYLLLIEQNQTMNIINLNELDVDNKGK